jgi:undecaprenyl diphosphate synthase
MEAIDKTKDNKRLTLNLALSYSSRWELVHMSQLIAEKVKKNELKPEEINEDTINSLLCTAGMPDPELLIRTSGEHRISNFLLWQIAYSELYFTETFWPDFRREHLYQAIVDFQQRERRFGMTSEQVI